MKDPNSEPLDATKIALINNNIGYIQRDINEIKGSVKELTGIYATKEDLSQTAQETETRLTKLEGASNLWKILNPAIAAILGSVITFLLVQYIMHIGK